MGRKILESVKVTTVCYNLSTLTNATSTSSFVNMANYDRVLFYVNQGAITSAPVLILTAYQATTTAGAGAVAISGASTTATCTASTAVTLEVRNDALSYASYPAYKYVGLTIKENNGGTMTNVMAVAIRGSARELLSTMQS